MDEPPTNRLPRRVAWFAPWTWRPWKRWVMLGLLLVGYVLLPMPLSYVMHRGGLNSYGPAFVPLIFATYPLRIAAENSTIVGGFYEAEWKWLEMTFGPALGEPFHLAYLDRPRASRVPTESA